MASLSKGTIYRIYSESERKEYIGSTTLKLSVRLSRHKTDYRKWLEDKNEDYCGSFEILKTDDYTIDVLEEVEVESKEELRKVEREWYDRRIRDIGRDRVVNKIRPYATNEETKEKNKETQKDYREKNKDKILEKTKEYREQNKDKISQHKKEYYQKNKDKISEHYEKNKDKISLKQNQKIHCKYCNCYTRKCNISTHIKTTKHITNFIKY
jgi:hypothetical protein